MDDPTLDLRGNTGKSEEYWRWRAHFDREFAAMRENQGRVDVHRSAEDLERDQAREDQLLSVAYRGRPPREVMDVEKARAVFAEASRNAWKARSR
jgi:hypothetical protein